ncbi:MAG TPA: M12 family metallopeptidase [Chitinophagaceae bacterium]
MKKVFLLMLFSLVSISFLFAQSKPKRMKCSVNVVDFLSKGIDTAESRGVADNYYLWDNGETISVKFVGGGSQALRKKVMEFAKEWELHANIKLQFVDDNTPSTHMRVKLGSGMGHNSYVGKYCNLIGQSSQTMNLDSSDFIDYAFYINQLKARIARKDTVIYSWDPEKFINDIKRKPNIVWNFKTMKGTVLHEFGHALGLLHEQSYPNAIKWNKADSVYAYYEKTQGWNREKVDAQVFEVSDQFYTNGTSYDPKSIMQYSIESWETLDGFSVGRNDELSTGDKSLIAALYPRGQRVSSREVPKVSITNLTRIDVVNGTVKKGLSIYPVFDLKTNSKLGQVYFVARLVDENGYYIRDNNDKFNWGGTVATYTKATLLPNTKKSYNKTKTKNLELFLPYAEIPAMNGKRVTIEFTVVLDDIANGQFNKLMYYSYTSPLSLPK